MKLLTVAPFALEHTLVDELDGLFLPWEAAGSPQPRLLALNEELAEEVGIDVGWLRSEDGVAVLAGNATPPDSQPVAMAYAGHQFGGYSPRLGDGRALLLGELIDRHGARRDLHLKGSGRTPFARGGDGKAAVGPMLREFLIGEAMAGLGIATTRALAVVATGEPIARETMLPGAVLARIAASHLRVGTFEYAVRLEDDTAVARLADYAIERHYPQLAGTEGRHLALLEAVVEAQAALVARWMLVGFIHGVMNTDNMTISGETIDYGPCAFMDRYDPATVFSSIDHGGRYAYGNQPGIAQWNLTRLAETLLGLIDPEIEVAIAKATEVLNRYPARFGAHYLAAMRTKLGLRADHAGAADDAGDQALGEDLLALLAAQQVDFTTAFRSLSSLVRDPSDRTARSSFNEPEAFDAWVSRWQDRLAAEARPAEEVAADLDRANPIYIPRNHLVEEALAAAVEGDLAPFDTLLDVVRRPFEPQQGRERYAAPGPLDGGRYQTFCGT